MLIKAYREPLKYLCLFTLLALTVAAIADEHESSGKFYLGPVVQWQQINRHVNIQDNEIFAPLLGYRFSEGWSGEVLFGKNEFARENGSRTDVSIQQYNLVRWINLDAGRRLQHFWLAGISRVEADGNGSADTDDTHVSIGLGLAAKLNNRLSFRADYRRYLGNLDDALLSSSTTVGIQWSLGKVSSGPVDSDGDGVSDERDTCPGTASGQPVDSSGCSLQDTDMDGVVDSRDNCPGTEHGRRVNSRGCEFDRDRDGVKDHDDRCADTPSGRRVGTNGCEFDTDGDGVKDGDDRCSGTKSGLAVNEQGCPLPKAPTRFDLNVEFDKDRTGIRTGETRELNEFIDFMNKHPKAVAVLEGHTDQDGARDYNQVLSELRATAVRRYLLKHSRLDASRLRTRGYGELRPIASNRTAAGKQRNRRVVATIVVKDN